MRRVQYLFQGLSGQTQAEQIRDAKQDRWVDRTVQRHTGASPASVGRTVSNVAARAGLEGLPQCRIAMLPACSSECDLDKDGHMHDHSSGPAAALPDQQRWP